MELAMVTLKRSLLIILRLLKAKEVKEQAVKSIMPSLTGSETLPAPIPRGQESSTTHGNLANYLRKKKCGNRDGGNKYGHATNMSWSSEDGNDIQLLNPQQSGSLARRLCRRTQGPEDKPRPPILSDSHSKRPRN